MQCQNCGSQEFVPLADGSAQCRYCGATIPGIYRPAPSGVEQQFNNIGTNFQAGRKDKIVTLLLIFFFGYVGGQYFYLGQVGKGVLCLLFFWTFIPTIIALVQFFIILAMSDTEFNNKYNNPYRK